ncbi:hypothetical protein TVAG_237320 [Trichomonas vaginalis G3]|uniref:Uncharacterized protein n=1 Tax=Trichomonas vaginalis (strain ATCC PRA-98 / G3) TaxID=412133 RepID=A2DCT2_TRIV3|nr:guanine nucleotide exchange c9orf72 family [Trichomonas vaginalis G3]EAY21706.1 hypothetical protein TVAG_237320 [Trichomonas vaginalis G3]KAI5524315.1 guanine nucleotide exchange c9orf72 family [Trichomonas vaginalis G3]|eukprot:XP_001582692.1 hypothetical protein [Trichomonas vaginalis G3]
MQESEGSPPLLAAALASFDIRYGVRIVHEWYPNHGKLPIALIELLKLTLSNVHRQEDNAFSQFLTSTTDIPSLNLFIVSSFFIIPQKKEKIYYNVSLILNRNQIDTTKFISNIEDTCKEIAIFAKTTLNSNLPINKLNILIQHANEVFEVLSKAGIKTLPDFSIHPTETPFLSLILSAHFHSQMNTIIESNNPDEAYKIAVFLAHFTLSQILETAPLEYLPAPIQGLSIQTISRQVATPEEILLTFKTPTTLIRLPEMQVIFSPYQDLQERSYGDYLVALPLENPEKEQRIAHVKAQYRELLNNATRYPWALATMSIMMQMPPESLNLICQLQLNNVVTLALSLIAVVQEKLDKGSLPFLSQDDVNDSIRILKLTGKEDLNMVASIAQIFDSSIQRKLFSYRKDSQFF